MISLTDDDRSERKRKKKKAAPSWFNKQKNILRAEREN